jgi:hypothetical protein
MKQTITIILLLLIPSFVSAGYFAKFRLEDEVYVSRMCAIETPQAESGFEWHPINDPMDVEIYQEPIILTEEQETEVLIQEKIRELAVASLKTEGKLDQDGKVIKGE